MKNFKVFAGSKLKSLGLRKLYVECGQENLPEWKSVASIRKNPFTKIRKNNLPSRQSVESRKSVASSQKNAKNIVNRIHIRPFKLARQQLFTIFKGGKVTSQVLSQLI